MTPDMSVSLYGQLSFPLSFYAFTLLIRSFLLEEMVSQSTIILLLPIDTLVFEYMLHEKKCSVLCTLQIITVFCVDLRKENILTKTCSHPHNRPNSDFLRDKFSFLLPFSLSMGRFWSPSPPKVFMVPVLCILFFFLCRPQSETDLLLLLIQRVSRLRQRHAESYW